MVQEKPMFSNASIKRPRNPPRCIIVLILDSRMFDHFLLADELFTKVLQALKLVYQFILTYVEN